MGGWLAGWIDGWVGGWVDGWMDGWVGGWVGGWVDGWVGGWVGGSGECVVKRGLPYGKRDLLYAQKRPIDILVYLRYAQVSKETYS